MRKAYVIAVVGSGGKSSLIEHLAEQSRKVGKKTAVMTTTHMRLPDQYSAVGAAPEEAAAVMDREGIVYYGSYAKEQGKMAFPGNEAYEALCRKADLILVEADGSRRLPMKVPNWPKEPVIPLNADAVMVMYGLSALGKPLEQVCHRWEIGKEWGYVPAMVTEPMAAAFLEKGYLRPIRFQFPNVQLITVLNQADSKERKHSGLRIKEALEQDGWECRLSQLRKVRISVIYMASGFGRRFGGNKLLEEYGGKALYRHGLDTFLKLKDWMEQEYGVELNVILVSQYEEILAYGRESGIPTVENPSASEGITASIRKGTEAADRIFDREPDPMALSYYLYSVADQPWLQAETLTAFINEFLDVSFTEQKTIGCLWANGRRGNPVIFHRKYRKELLALTGDKGGSQIMKRYPGEVLEFTAEEKELADIDCREDL